ncbi:DUF4405 domain-containing protein [Fibrella aquatilis]|uniref:DUF4405 domain-containing protein n=1 Tax=Fibrella aquatilis TaxID=2817059 RepID=A0A939GCE1_9BACT|nr:DUF4405 domain-containing protein [Fibrella aquatilis]MBO0933813.1 DUF4405 domain-containing protein [Fibrella aquatilis]
MKSKNLVSLSVATVFAVLSITGLLIYFGQGSHLVEHTHAWFGVLFVAAAIFHIVNNWASIKGYSTDKKTGGIRRELIVASVVALLFLGGIAADLPGFKALPNGGKALFGKKRGPGGPEGRPGPPNGQRGEGPEGPDGERGMGAEQAVLTKTAIDSIARQMVAQHLAANAQTIRFDTTAALGHNVILAQGTATPAKPGSAKFRFTQVITLADHQWKVAAKQTAPL